MKMKVNLLSDINGLLFGADRETTRKTFGKKYKEIRKSVLSKNTMDVYDGFSIYYSEDNRFEAVEVWGDVSVIIEKVNVYPGKIERILPILPDAEREGDYVTSTSCSVGVTINQDDNTVIESILIGRKGYYTRE